MEIENIYEYLLKYELFNTANDFMMICSKQLSRISDPKKDIKRLIH